MNDVIFNEYVRPDIEALRASDCQHEWSMEPTAIRDLLTIPGFSCVRCSLTLKPNTVLYFLTEITQSKERANLLTFSLYGQIDNIRQEYDRLPLDGNLCPEPVLNEVEGFIEGFVYSEAKEEEK